MDIALDGKLGDLLGRREQGTHLHIEAHIAESRGDHLLAAIMAVLSDLGDEDARRPSIGLAEGAHRAARLIEPVALARRFIYALDRAALGRMPAPGLFQGER